MFLQMSNGFPTGTVRDQNRIIIGFGMLRIYNPMPAFSQTVEATYFMHPDTPEKHWRNKNLLMGVTAFTALVKENWGQVFILDIFSL